MAVHADVITERAMASKAANTEKKEDKKEEKKAWSDNGFLQRRRNFISILYLRIQNKKFWKNQITYKK